jgi:AcrR family transcriptional regulator
LVNSGLSTHHEGREEGAMPGQRAPEEVRREQILNAAYAVALREGIDGVTVRAVAAEAALSHGLLVFYFRQKDQLIDALLDRVLATAALLQLPDDVERLPPAPDRLRTLLRQQLERLAREPHDFRLFLEYWALGTRRPAIRAKIAAALDRYRGALRTMAEAMLRADPVGHPEATPDGFAAVAVSLVTGCAIQAMIDPDAFDLAAYMGTVTGLVEQVGAPPRP